MAGITNGRPDLAVGEPIHLGEDFEIEQHPVSDRLIIRDTASGKVAYVRAERGGEIGGDGVLIKALKEEKPMADDGRTYDTIQQAERAASSWVFVPPGTYNEGVEIKTDELTLQGCGYNSLIVAGAGVGLEINAENVTVENLRVEASSDDAIRVNEGRGILSNITVEEVQNVAIQMYSETTVTNCTLSGGGYSMRFWDDNCIVANCVMDDGSTHTLAIDSSNNIIANNIIKNAGNDNIIINSGGYSNQIIVGNRVINAGRRGVDTNTDSTDTIIANNRVSDSGEEDIRDRGTNNLLHENLTGPSN